MSNFKEGIRVAIIHDGEILEGKITKLYAPVDIAIVSLDNGDFVKAKLSELAIIKEEKTEEEKEPVEKSEITITPEEFSAIACKVIAENTDSIVVALSIGEIMAKLHEALFIDEGENE